MAASLTLPAVLALLAAVLPLRAATAGAQSPRLGMREVQLVNHAPHAINEVYASPSASDEWGDDRLGEAMIAPGGNRRLHLGRGPCEVDIQVVYDDASREECHRLDICRTRQVVFDGSAAVAPPGMQVGTHAVMIVNGAGRPIQQVQVSPAEAGDWGDDLLGHNSLSVGDRATVTYRGGCLADLRVVFDNRSAEERRDLDLCALRGVRVQPGWTTADVLAPLTPPAADATTSGTAPPLSVTVLNQSGHAVRGLFLAAEGAPDRGADLLGSGVLEDGAQVIVVVPRPQAGCRFEAHLVFGGKLADEAMPGLDLCRQPRLVVAAP